MKEPRFNPYETPVIETTESRVASNSAWKGNFWGLMLMFVAAPVVCAICWIVQVLAAGFVDDVLGVVGMMVGLLVGLVGITILRMAFSIKLLLCGLYAVVFPLMAIVVGAYFIKNF